jgi:hypothetical protein
VVPLDFLKFRSFCLQLAESPSILVLQNQNPNFMKKRISRVLNFFAFNLLFFALYLNFIHKDNNSQSVPASKTTAATAPKGTVLVSNPEQYLNKIHKEEVPATAQLQN